MWAFFLGVKVEQIFEFYYRVTDYRINSVLYQCPKKEWAL